MTTTHRRKAAFACFALLVACSSKGEHEAIATDMAQCMEDLAQILEGVKHEAGVKAAVTKLDAVTARMNALKKRMDAAGAPADTKAMGGKELEELVGKATQRMMQAMMQLAQDDKVMAVLGPVLEKMDK